MRCERVFAHPIDHVWTTITDPGELAHWFPAPQVSIEPWLGGTMAFGGDPCTDDTGGTVIAWEPPTCLAFSWGPDELHFHLQALDATTRRLVLLDVLEGRDAAARNAGGWLVCLGELAQLLAGSLGQGQHGDAPVARWHRAYEAHVAAGLPYGAQIPEPSMTGSTGSPPSGDSRRVRLRNRSPTVPDSLNR